VCLHRCGCGERYEQWGSRPTPLCPTCEKTRFRKTAPDEKDTERTGRDGKRTKYDESKDKGKKIENTQPHRTKVVGQSPTPHVFLDPTLGSRMGILATSLTTPLQAPALRYKTGTRHDSASKKVERRMSLAGEPERNVGRSPSPTKSGRGLRNTGNMCFLNATIQCLGAIDEVIQMHISTEKSTTTQDRHLVCVRELQGTGTAYTPAPLIQQIPNLIRYNKEEPADAHELLIAPINDISEPISRLFQGQMASTVKCSSCDRSTTKTDAQDISLHIEEDASLSLEESLYDFFQPETLEGENAYWCDTCQTSCRATKTLFYTRTPTILKRLILGKKIQNHIPFDTTLDLEPYMTPGYSPTHDMKLVGIISHQGTKDNGHYTAMTKRDDKWTLYNDAITTQTTTKHIHQTQAYILMYRKRNKEQEWGSQQQQIYQKNWKVNPGQKGTSTLDQKHSRREKPQLHSRNY